MEKREADSYMPVYILFTTASGLLWLGLIGLKALDVVSMGWTAVLLGVWWIPLLILTMAATLAAVLVTALHIPRAIRKWKVKRRIKRQRKALQTGAHNQGPKTREALLHRSTTTDRKRLANFQKAIMTEETRQCAHDKIVSNKYMPTTREEETICGVTGNKCSDCSQYGCGSKRKEKPTNDRV